MSAGSRQRAAERSAALVLFSRASFLFWAAPDEKVRTPVRNAIAKHLIVSGMAYSLTPRACGKSSWLHRRRMLVVCTGVVLRLLVGNCLILLGRETAYSAVAGVPLTNRQNRAISDKKPQDRAGASSLTCPYDV